MEGIDGVGDAWRATTPTTKNMKRGSGGWRWRRWPKKC